MTPAPARPTQLAPTMDFDKLEPDRMLSGQEERGIADWNEGDEYVYRTDLHPQGLLSAK